MAAQPSYAVSADALTVTNLHSLGDAAYWQSASRDNDTELAIEVHIFVTLVTTTTADDAAGYCNIYMAGSVDGGTDFAGGASGSEGSYTSTAESHKNLELLGTMAMKADETTARTFKQMFRYQGIPPKDYSIVIENQTGTGLAASSNVVEVMEIQVANA